MDVGGSAEEMTRRVGYINLVQNGDNWHSCKKGRTCRSHNVLTSWELLALQGLCRMELHHSSQNLQTRMQKHQAEDNQL